jgi:hypothetical protein
MLNSIHFVIASEAKQSILLLRQHGLLRRCAPRNDEQSLSRGANFARVVHRIVAPSPKRGRRECRALNRTRNPVG